MTALKAPFPWFGGKSRVADLIWSRLGADVNRYIEPFFGSGATLLARRLPPDGVPDGGEVANDYDGLLANFWRAIQADPAGVAHFADYPISEIDLGARHAWLVARKARLKWALEDPDFYDIKAAGWWVWGQSQWIGGGFCSGTGPWRHDGAQFFKAKDVAEDLEAVEGDVSGGGISRRIPGCSERDRKGVHSATIAGCRSQTGNSHPSGGGCPAPDAWHHRASESGCPIRSQPLRGGLSLAAFPASQLAKERRSCATASPMQPAKPVCRGGGGLESTFAALAHRLRRVVVVSGDWSRVVTDGVIGNKGQVAIFLDPPYSLGERAGGLYGEDHDVGGAVREWAIANGDRPQLRICLAGYEGEHIMPDTWACVPWKAVGGYGNQGEGRGKANAGRERLWFSPGCLEPMGLLI